jgi:hypothetical protein
MMIRTVTGIFLVASIWTAVAQEKSNPCIAEFTTPQSGDRVAGEGDVSGSAKNLPAGSHVWVFAHRRGLGLWWPQGGGAAKVQDGKWLAFVTYGQNRDLGSDFELTVAVLADAADADMNNWIKRAEETGQYPGVRLPASQQGCITKSIVVTRDR